MKASGKDLDRLQFICSCLSTLFAVVFVSLIYKYNGFLRLDYQLYDLNFRWRGVVETSGKIVLVLMDDQSAVELARERAGWSRLQTAMALTNLCNAGAEVIGLDVVYFSADQNPLNDEALAEAMAACNNVVLARTTSTSSGAEKSALPLFQNAMVGDGFIDVPLDQDEVLRKIRFFNAKPLADGSLQLLPSFSLELVRSFLYLDYLLDFSANESFVLGDPQGDNIRLPYPELIINYSGNFDNFHNIPFADVVKNRFSPDEVRGKLVIIGSNLVTDKDLYTTPFSKTGMVSESVKNKFGTVVGGVLGQKEYGVVCHAHAAETILSGKFITRPNSFVIYILILFFGLAGLLYYLPTFSMVLEYFFFALMLGGIVSVGYILFLQKLVWLDTAPLLIIVSIQFVAGVVMQKGFARKKTAMVTSLFGRYVSGSVVQELIKGDIDATLQGQRRELTILFSDLRNFTTLSEELGATDTTLLLNSYFDAMIPLVFNNNGTLDKLIGDEIMAFFGSPLDLPAHANDAAMTALAMMTTLVTLKKSGKVRGLATLDIGIGINTGEVTVGNLGSKDFMDYTIIGDAVNLASRLEGLNKVYGTHILVSEFSVKKMAGKFILRELDIVRVKGKLRAVTLYELLGIKPECSGGDAILVDLFADGLALFRERDWRGAEISFLEILDKFPEDGPSLLYVDRIRRYQKNPPPDNWDGVMIFDHK